MVRASVIWLNYNSMKFIDIALKSLESFLNLDFDDYELIIVDNASSDGSFEMIKKYVEEHRRGVRVKVIRNDRNLGYAGGMNIGWEARDPDSKYVAFANNDLIATPESLTKLIERMDCDEKIGAVSGLIYYPDGRTICTAGGSIDELWVVKGICNELTTDECPGIDKEYYITFSSGEYMVVKVNAIRDAIPSGKPFIDETFLYLDDDLLGLMLWNRGYEVKYAPINAGTHYAGKTTKGFLRDFYQTRAATALSYIAKTRYSNTMIGALHNLRRYAYILIDRIKYQGFIDGMRLGKILLERIGKLNLYCAPYREVTLSEAINELLLIRYHSSKAYAVRPNELKMKNYATKEC